MTLDTISFFMFLMALTIISC